MVKKLISFLFIFSVAAVPFARAQWLNNGEPVTDSPYAKTKGEFGAMLIFTDKPDELFEEWNKDTLMVKADIDTEEVKQNGSLTAAIIFSNCTPDKKGMANVSVKFSILNPVGKIIAKTEELEVWMNKPAPAKKMLELSVQYMRIPITEGNPAGFYTVQARVHDKNSGTKIDLERTFKVIEDKQNSRFIWVKIISTPRAAKGAIVPKSTKGFRHMTIVSDILPHGMWEVGPDLDGNIVTTNTTADLSQWQTYLVTQKCIELGGDYVRVQFVEVNKKGLMEAINLYEKGWVGQKYSRFSYNENYAVESVVYGAGGDVRKAKETPPD